jgi:hypothetical protein
VSAGTSKLMKLRHRGSTSLTVVDRLCLVLTINGRHIPFVDNIKYVGIIFDNYMEITHTNARSQGIQNIY